MIALTNIEKIYDGNMVLNDISLEIPMGQATALIGANGCGKSTLLKIIAGLVKPTKGKVDIGKGKLIHYVPEHFPKMNLTAGQYLSYMGKLDGLGDTENDNRIHELATDFSVDSMLDVPMKHLSKGSLQKIGVIQALMKRPDILLLDEPLSGQDVRSQQVFIRKIRELEKNGVTVLMSCHEPYLVDALAKKTYRLENGKVEEATVESLRNEVWYTLFFVRGESAVVPKDWQGRLQFTEEGCNLRAAEEECDSVVTNMLDAGWSLRGMWNEERD